MNDQKKQWKARVLRVRNIGGFNFAAVFVLLLIIEGFASYLRVGYHFLTRPVAERAYSEYDEELGWINLPNVHIKDMYGPGVYLTTNSQRYRNVGDFSPEVPDGKIRIVCSGDSFTLGYGVNDEQTWCQQLALMDDRFETVNLGQGGYGVDQAYLWYQRNEKKLEHNFHIFAFITSDFGRMESDTFAGYGKPHLVLRDGAIVQENKPVSKRAYYAPWVTRALRVLPELDTVSLLSTVSEKVVQKDHTPFDVSDTKATKDVASRIFAELQLTNQAKQSSLVLAYLPTLGDYTENATTAVWREFVQTEVQDNGYFLVDVVDELRSLHLRPTELFDRHRHYSIEGNKYVADILHKKLNQLLPDSGELPE